MKKIKNDYLTITIKFGIRFLGYIIAFISNYIFGLSALFMVFQISIVYYMIYLRTKENKV